MIRLEGIGKEFGDFTAVKELSLEIPEGKTCVMVGPSGCGKTTTMRMVNRLIEPTRGTVYIDDQDYKKKKVEILRRDIGYVIQEVGLFPHRTIAENISTTPKLAGWDDKKIKKRVDELLEIVELNPEENRNKFPRQLSGGQRQRVGLARAMAADPPVMLMDEPFAAVDPITRENLQNMFLRLQRKMKKTIIFVTHDINEAIKMGDQIAILKEGELVQADTPEELLANPKNQFVTDFIGVDRAIKILDLFSTDEVMWTEAPVISKKNMQEEAQKLIEKGEKGIPVIVEDEQGNKFWFDLDELESGQSLEEIIRPLEITLEPTNSIKLAMARMLEHNNDAVLIIGDDDEEPGILTLKGIRNYVYRICASDPGEKVGI